MAVWVRRYWWPAPIVAFIAIALPGPLIGQRPATWDHVVHYTKAVNFIHRLHHLDLWSWDWSMFAGYPTEYSYPITSDALVALVYGLSIGSITVSHAYALAFFAAYLFGAGAVYWTFTRWIGRPAALITVFLYIVDLGAVHEGGWYWTTLYGVWPVFLAVALDLLFLSRCAVLAKGDSTVSAPGLGALLAVTMLTHPVQLILVPLMLAALGLWMIAERELRNRVAAWRTVRGLALAGGIAAVLAAFWYVPFLANARFTQDHGKAGTEVLALLVRIAKGQPFTSMAPVAAWAGLIGLVVGCFRPGPTRLIAIACGLCLGALTTLPRNIVIAITGFDLNRSIEFDRIGMLAKPFWFAAAAWALVALVRFVHRKAGRRGVIALAAVAIVAAAFAPVLFIRVPVPFPMLPRSSQELAAMSEVGRWLDARADEGGGFFRAGHSLGEDHDLIELSTLTKVPLLKFSFTPALTYFADMRPVTEEVVDLCSVRYIVVPDPLAGPHVTLRTQFPPYFIYENDAWNPSPVRVLHGEGAIAGAVLGHRGVRFDAAPGAAGTALVAAGYFPNWRATRDGRPIPIAPFPIDGDRAHTMMTVDLAPGHYELTFTRLPWEWAAFVVSLAGWVVLAIWVIARKR